MDPLSDVLSLLKPRSYTFGGFDVGGDWSIRFGRHEGIKCYAVVSGQCWLSVEGVPDPVRLKTGDCFLLPRGWPFCLTNDLALPPIDARALFSRPKNGGIRLLNGGGDFWGVGGHFVLSGDNAGILLGVLPPIVHIRSETDKTALRWSMERMMQELREPRPGSFLVAQHLAYMMLIQALRLHLAETPGGVGWLFALEDKQIGGTINAMHQDPAHRWTLQELAEHAGMSRSTFALRFKQLVGKSPMDYLTRWRMLLAADRLANSSDPISVIALSLGYESESAFSTAFKRAMGCSPRQYGRRGISDAPPFDEDVSGTGHPERMAG
ncbi:MULTISPECIES: AraC family transcriptional regulator [Rhizobium]|uniref:AraC family transcriptional regulator n=1 Tax=Rhizobium TaxID=379 RepID=UPI00195DE620|nr:MULTISPECIES: AraC family transcriptional regulator [Rhizobium]MBM7044191.1 AraC family transcriptional regulator [Rhizobium lusitanum]